MELLFLLAPTLQFKDFVTPENNVGTNKKADGRSYGMVLTDLPLGIISLSAYLKKHIKINVNTLDFNVLLNKADSFNYETYTDYFQSEIEKYKNQTKTLPDYVGISALFTSSHQSIIDLANLSKRIYPEARCIVGGNYPTAAYGKLLNECDSIDAICYGEGEKPLLELLTAPIFEDYIAASKQWIDKKKLKNPMRTLEHNFIVDLDEIPPYDYDCVDVDGYRINPNSSRYKVTERYTLSKGDDHTEAGEETIGSVQSIGQITYSMPIMTSRGCPFKCTFCASHVAHGRDMRYHSLERVVHDIKRLIQKYGIDGVVIQDDHFMGGKRRPYEIVKAIGEMNLGMYFQNALAIYALDLPFLQLLKESGVNQLVLPLESGSSRVLKNLMKKPLRLSVVPRVLNDCREAGIFTDVNIIIGMPGETKQDINESREFLKSIYADWFRIFSAMPIEGSEMYERCNAEGLFRDDSLNANYKRPVINTGDMSPEEISEFAYLMNIELNFVYNSNIRLGRYEIALKSFENVLRVKPDHAIAHFFIAHCLNQLGLYPEADSAYAEFEKFLTLDPFWEKYVSMFGLKGAVTASDALIG